MIPVAEWMISSADHGAVLAVTALCTSILVLAETVRRAFAVECEWTRNLVHVLMGLTAAASPWLFCDGRSVVLLCALFAVVPGASLAFSGLPSIHRVDRRTAGALWFPLGVAWVFLAAHGRSDLYLMAMLVLTFADPAAAMVGRARGTHRPRLGAGAKPPDAPPAFFPLAPHSLLA